MQAGRQFTHLLAQFNLESDFPSLPQNAAPSSAVDPPTVSSWVLLQPDAEEESTQSDSDSSEPEEPDSVMAAQPVEPSKPPSKPPSKQHSMQPVETEFALLIKKQQAEACEHKRLVNASGSNLADSAAGRGKGQAGT